MNSVLLIGRLTKDPELRYSQSGVAVCRFSIAIDRGKDKNGKDMGADFPQILCFGKTAENCDKYLGKGMQCGVTGRIQTGSYEGKDGKKVYTTEVLADRIEFLGNKTTTQGKSAALADENNPFGGENGIPSGFNAITDDDIPF